MARPIVITLAANTTYVVPVDDQQSPFCLRWGVAVASGGTISYTVKYTLDDVNDAAWTTIWTIDSVAGTAQTTTKDNTYLAPIRALQVVTTTLTVGGRLTILQGSSAR